MFAPWVRAISRHVGSSIAFNFQASMRQEPPATNGRMLGQELTVPLSHRGIRGRARPPPRQGHDGACSQRSLQHLVPSAYPFCPAGRLNASACRPTHSRPASWTKTTERARLSLSPQARPEHSLIWLFQTPFFAGCDVMSTIGISLLLLVTLAADDKPAPKVKIGKDTTYVEGPLDKDGYIDYEIALNKRLSEGIKPETNANALLMKAFGPKPESTELPADYYKWL